MLLLVLRLRLQELTLASVIKMLRMLGASLTSAGDQIKDLQREIGQWSAQFDADFPWNDEEAPVAENILEEVEDALANQLQSRLPELAKTVAERTQQQFLTTHGGLRNVCQKADSMRAGMLAALRAEARAEVLSALKGIALGDAVLGSGVDVQQQTTRLLACQNVARPKLIDCAGSQRMLALVPASDANAPLIEALKTQLDPAPSILTSGDADLVLCFEQQELSLPHVAARLIAGRNDYTEIAARLHTRADVTWIALPNLVTSVAAKSAKAAASPIPPGVVPPVAATQPSAALPVEQ
jgi:hypothetical protein